MAVDALSLNSAYLCSERIIHSPEITHTVKAIEQKQDRMKLQNYCNSIQYYRRQEYLRHTYKLYELFSYIYIYISYDRNEIRLHFTDKPVLWLTATRQGVMILFFLRCYKYTQTEMCRAREYEQFTRSLKETCWHAYMLMPVQIFY